MIDEIKSFTDKISENSLLLFAVFAAGVVLLLTGAAGGINFNKLSMPIVEFSLKITVVIVGVSLIITTVCLLFFGNRKADKDCQNLKLKIKEIEENIYATNKAVQQIIKEKYKEMTLCTQEDINQQKNDDAAFCMLRKLLNSESKIHKPEIIEAFSSASLAARYQIFGAIKQYREDMVHKLLERHETEEIKIKANISCLVAPLEVLVEIEQNSKNSQCTHEIFINLAYAYKDSRHPLWDRALKFIDLAIKDRDSRNIDRRFYVNYEINRILCNIFLKNYNFIDNDFEWIWSFNDGRDHVMTVPPVLFPDFYDWMANNKMNNITEWLRQHPDKQDEWFKMFSLDQFKEKIRRNL